MNRLFSGEVTDMFNGSRIVYPMKTQPRLRYDFCFTKKGTPFYVSSCDDLSKFRKYRVHEPAEANGESWWIIDTRNSEIVDGSTDMMTKAAKKTKKEK